MKMDSVKLEGTFEAFCPRCHRTTVWRWITNLVGQKWIRPQPQCTEH
jgi:hypothetical protein